jgi:hypothetical protein
MAASGVVPALIYKQRLASFSVRPTLRRIATALMAAAQVKGARLIEERVLAGEVELVWDVRRSHPVPTALSDHDKFRRYTAFRPYPVYRHPEQSLQDSIARLRPRRLRRLSQIRPTPQGPEFFRSFYESASLVCVEHRVQKVALNQKVALKWRQGCRRLVLQRGGHRYPTSPILAQKGPARGRPQIDLLAS